jgi:hypothetical protein
MISIIIYGTIKVGKGNFLLDRKIFFGEDSALIWITGI